MAKDGNPIFGVRMRKDLQDAIRARARSEDLTVAEWLERVLRPVLEADPRPTAEQRLERLEHDLTAIRARLDTLEGSKRAAPSKPSPRSPQRQSAGTARAAKRSGPNRTPPETVARIMELSAQGWSGHRIAKEVGRTAAGVNKIIQREREKGAANG